MQDDQPIDLSRPPQCAQLWSTLGPTPARRPEASGQPSHALTQGSGGAAARQQVGPQASPQAGVTLIELVATLAILTILLTLGASNMSRMIASNRVSTAANTLVGAFNFARAEAVFRGTTVGVCAADVANLPGNGSDPCRTGGAGDTRWAEGYVVFLPENNDVLRIQEGNNAVTIRHGSNRLQGPIGFLPTGARAGTTNFSLQICGNPRRSIPNQGLHHEREVSVTPMGRSHINEIKCSQ